jgi:hypothetical protein
MPVTFHGGSIFLSTDLVNEMLSAQVCQMRPFFLIRQVCADSLDHHHYESSVIHIQPVGAADEFIIAVSYERFLENLSFYERTVNILAQVWLVKSSYGRKLVTA